MRNFLLFLCFNLTLCLQAQIILPAFQSIQYRRNLSPSSNGTAIISTFNSCSIASAGTLTAGVAASGVNQTINVTVGIIGTYAISATANGVTFAATGTFSTTGSQNIILIATGTPIASGTNTFTLNTTPNCNFSLTTSTDSLTVTDIDGNTYQTVKICDQIWTQSNLNVSHYRNGDVIPQVTDPNAWASLTTGAWCYYNNDPANEAVYGKLYNWYAVTDSRGLAPQGWHIPSKNESVSLAYCAGGTTDFYTGNNASVLNIYRTAGGNLKEIGTTLWTSPNVGATNFTNFYGLPSGLRGTDGIYQGIGLGFSFWSKTADTSWPPNTTNLNLLYWYNGMGYGNSDFIVNPYGDRGFGLAVRCIKD